MRVRIERFVQHVRDGLLYKGHITIAEITLHYMFEFRIPIPQLATLAESGVDPEEVRSRIVFTMKRGGESIELTEGELDVFFNLLLSFVLDFYYNHMTRVANEGSFGTALHGEGPMAQFGVEVSAGVRGTATCEFSEVAREMLSSQKFGCALA